LNYLARRIIGTIGTGFEISFLEAANFDPASSLIDIPLRALISQLAATAALVAKRTTGSAISTATTYI
jgi:hypothetical protein